MKKYRFLISLIFSLIILSCTADDPLDDLNSEIIENPTQGGEEGTPQDTPDPEQSIPEKLSGSWLLRDRTEIGVTYCELQTRYTFNADHTFELDFYSGDEPGNCESVLTYGSWHFLGDHDIRIDFENTPMIDTINVRFSQAGQQMMISHSSTDYAHIETYKKQ